MDFVNTQVNVVVLAGAHNPTILTKDWVAHEGFNLGEVKNFVHTPPFSRIDFENGLAIQVQEPRLLISQRGEGLVPEESMVPRVVKDYVSLLRHTPYTAHGVNFDGHIPFDTEDDAAAFLRERYLRPDSIVLPGVDPQNIGFGFKITYPCGDNTCTLSADPKTEDGQARVSVHFNYHVPIPGYEAIVHTMDSIGEVWETFKDGLANLTG